MISIGKVFKVVDSGLDSVVVSDLDSVVSDLDSVVGSGLDSVVVSNLDSVVGSGLDSVVVSIGSMMVVGCGGLVEVECSCGRTVASLVITGGRVVRIEVDLIGVFVVVSAGSGGFVIIMKGDSVGYGSGCGSIEKRDGKGIEST